MEILVCVRKLILQRKKKTKKKSENELFSVYTVWFIDLYTGRLCGIEQKEYYSSTTTTTHQHQLHFGNRVG
jgi:hypothetical protein